MNNSGEHHGRDRDRQGDVVADTGEHSPDSGAETAERSFKRAWSNIDQAEDPGYFVRFMDGVSPRKPHDSKTLEETFAILELRPGDRVLDVGCGLGGAVRAIAERVGATGLADRKSTRLNS